MIYELSKVTKVYGKRTALDLDHLAVREGDIYALLGPNGGGKTTLLRIMAFLDSPSSGRVSFDGKELSFTERSLQPLRRQVVMVNQRPILFTTTVYKNLAFGLKIRQVPPRERHRIIEASLELVGLGHLSGAPAQSLSGGETQRVAIARALALAPKVILCDEPTANVDIENQTVIVNLLQEINREKKITIVFTTHDRLQATALADHALFMDRGKLTASPYENLFTATLTPRAVGMARCVIKGLGPMDIPTERSGRVRLHIDPAKVSLTREARSDSAVRGKVTRIVYDRERVRIRVESDVTVRVSISERVYKAEKFLVGEDLFLAVDPDGVELL